MAYVLRFINSDLRGATILDAGCGDGLYTCLLANLGGTAIGVDISALWTIRKNL